MLNCLHCLHSLHLPTLRIALLDLNESFVGTTCAEAQDAVPISSANRTPLAR